MLNKDIDYSNVIKTTIRIYFPGPPGSSISNEIPLPADKGQKVCIQLYLENIAACTKNCRHYEQENVRRSTFNQTSGLAKSSKCPAKVD